MEYFEMNVQSFMTFFLEEFLVFTIRAYLLSYYNQALLCLFLNSPGILKAFHIA